MTNGWNDWLNEPRVHPLQPLFNGSVEYLKIQAPMVRYSKLPFRKLVKLYNVDLTYTPMILSDVYKHSTVSREIEYRTNRNDTPVIVQFAASKAIDLADASELVAKYCNGVDLNCGCPQRWASADGHGAFLMEKPELVGDMISQAKSRTMSVKMANGSSFPVSVKIRVHSDLKKTIEFVRRAEKMGADWITVHGRTANQKSTEPVCYESIRIAKESVNIPVFGNGSIYTLLDANEMVRQTKVNGVMAARGLLENPGLFAGHLRTPLSCIQEYASFGIQTGTTFFIYHHHLMSMLDSQMSRIEKKRFNVLTTIPCILDYLEEHYNIFIE